MTYHNFPLPTIVYNCLQRPVRPLWFSHLSHIHQLALVKSNTAHTCSEYMLSTHYAIMPTVDQRCSMKLNVFFWTFAHLFCLASGRPILTPAHLPPEQLVQRNLLSKASRIPKYKQDKPSCKPYQTHAIMFRERYCLYSFNDVFQWIGVPMTIMTSRVERYKIHCLRLQLVEIGRAYIECAANDVHQVMDTLNLDA